MRLNFEAPAARATLAVVAGFVLGLLALLNAATPTMAEGPLPPADQRADATIAAEGFEGAFPGTAWSLADSDATFGLDGWSTSTYRTAAGARSGYAAGAGDRLEDAVALNDTFETGATGWSRADNDVNYGDDFWGLSDYRAHSGTYSFWCAQEGVNAEYGDYDYNVNFGYYDSYMNTSLTRPVDLTGFASATFEFWYWMDTEPEYDYFYVAYFDGVWHYVHARDGSSNGWAKDTLSIPTATTIVGFLFISDSTVVYPGVWVDSPMVYGKTRTPNAESHLYDDGMDAAMTRSVDFSGFEWARVDYQYWTSTEAGPDYLGVIYFTDAWHAAATHTGNSNGFQAASAEVPVAATRVGFRFVSDGNTRAEGAYIDDIRVIGSVGKLLCSAGVEPRAGTEALTEFSFAPAVQGGLRPLTWTWAFGDGTISSAASPTHVFNEVGTYSALVTVRDQLGQSCSTLGPELAVGHDTSSISVTPPYTEVTEGVPAVLSAFDARGHALAFVLTVSPPECGAISMEGSAVVLATSEDAGGLTCMITASMGGTTGTATVVEFHDTNAPSVSPVEASVQEGGSLELFAHDTFGHALEVGWTASCGRVDPTIGTTTTFFATTTGGRVCQVTAQYERLTPSASITITHDTSDLGVSPLQAALIEGDSARFTIADKQGHPIEAQWSVEPASCGGVSPATGTTTTFTSAVSSGGLTCEVRGALGSVSKAAIVTVNHDWSDGALEPPTALVQEGRSATFSGFDANHHATGLQWAVTPSTCGSVDPLVGPSTTFAASATAGGSTCTIQAVGGSLVLRAQVGVVDGPPATIEVAVAELQAGRTASATASVKDGDGGALPGSLVSWTTDCASVSPSAGAEVEVAAADRAAGITCRLTAMAGTVSKTVDVLVAFARPYIVTITPEGPAPLAGQSQRLTLEVTDAAGNPMDPGAVTWAATCGDIAGTGAEATFTAPSAPGTCSVTATVGVEGATVAGAIGVPVQAAGPSGGLLIGAGAAAAAAALGLLLFVRRAKTPKKP